MKTIYHKFLAISAFIITLFGLSVTSISAQAGPGTYGCMWANVGPVQKCIPSPAKAQCNTAGGYQVGPGCDSINNQGACDAAVLVCQLNAGGGGKTTTIQGNCGNFGEAVSTAIGCVPINDKNALISFFIGWSVGIAGGIALILIIVAGFMITTSRGDPTRLKAGQELLTSAVSGIILLIFAVFILRIVGVELLGIPIGA